ncbi:Protein of uncharacterised function (DUF2910) [Mycobacteroides abscessus subsp. bolletii]|nr:Protein of uncharacterised function (DUF2910) [Mycobacteroides abscessus subsp. bolletii]
MQRRKPFGHNGSPDHRLLLLPCIGCEFPKENAPISVVFGPVWGLLLAMAIMFAVNPVLLAVIVLMISRPRPVQNLAAYWLGSMIVSLAGLLVPLAVLHVAPSFRSFVENMAVPGSNVTTRVVNLGMGLLMLSIATLLAVRALREHTHIPVAASNVPTIDSEKPRPITSPFGVSSNSGGEAGSIFRRTLRHLQNAWEQGTLWVAFVFGLCGLPPPMLVIFVLTPVVASGSTIGTQIIAVIAFVFGMFTVVELTLICYLIAPARTIAVLQPLHDWALAHRRQMLITIFSIAGIIQVINGVA